ncbi:hypothetical protein [uncultured Sphingomonas sp.]|uniref:hypothetical protein n=1 Tax=uncultured Sphingomonas sp. TaxID=158754 RepID=UPI0025CC6F97|nr:hypothetical protein [uncultured Sphingomonas sp.]
MPNVAVLPTPLTHAALAANNPRNAHTCGIFDIAGRMGYADRSIPWICRQIDGLIAQANFPKPFPLVKGGRLTAKVGRRSKWAIPAVDAWFDEQLPPGAQASARDAERVAVDSRLNANLGHLFPAVGGRA